MQQKTAASQKHQPELVVLTNKFFGQNDQFKLVVSDASKQPIFLVILTNLFLQ